MSKSAKKPSQSSQQTRHGRTNGGVRVVAIETECRRDAPDHIGCQDLHDE
jgi:hypothetical protein